MAPYKFEPEGYNKRSEAGMNYFLGRGSRSAELRRVRVFTMNVTGKMNVKRHAVKMSNLAAKGNVDERVREACSSDIQLPIE